jgi:cytochrome P450
VNLHSSIEGMPIPPHVDPRLVIDYDVYGDRRFYETGDLHEGLYKLGEEVGRGIFWTPRNGGHWLINSHELMFEAVRNYDVFSSNNKVARYGAMVMIPAMGGDEPIFAPQSLDPPDHGVFRKPLMKAFAPARVMEMEAGVRELARGMIDNIASLGRAEFLSMVAEPLPVTVFMKMMGMPLERIHEFRDYMANMASDDADKRAYAFGNIDKAMGELIRERVEKRQNDLISRLLDEDVGGRTPTYDEMQSYCLLLFTAGLDTLVNAFTFGTYQLARMPELQERIRADRSLINPLIEEILRRYAIAMPPRLVAQDTEFGGATLKAGDLVMLMLPAANLDPTAFDDPLTFDIDRAEETHMTFNSGPHRCVGSHLARLEMRVFFEEWFERMPTVLPDPAEPPTYRPGLNLTICKLPLIWEPVA